MIGDRLAAQGYKQWYEELQSDFPQGKKGK